MLVNCRITKQLYNDPVSGFKILSCKPKNKPKDLVLSQYGTFTINGNNLSGLSINQEVELNIVSNMNPSHPESYKVIGLGAFKPNGEKIDVDPKQELNILSGFMTASQAKNVNEAYPNFVSMILNGQEDKIDYKKIHGVGKKYLASYIQKVKSAYHYIRFIPIITKYSIEDINIAQKLSILYGSPSELNEDMRLHPYHVFIDVLDMSFTKADKLIVKNRQQFIDSPERCEYACIDLLKKNETFGNTRILANELASMVYDIASETLDNIVSVVSNSKRIHYDASSKQISLEATYQSEQLIADNIQHRLDNPTITSMQWQDYIEVDGLKLTDEQQAILQVVQDNNVTILTGSAGCGKSQSMKALIYMLEDNGYSHTMLCPTGTAAQVLSRATNRHTSTIHMFLANNIGCGDFLILEESSMIGVELLAMLLGSIPKETKIIFICDPSQLPSISCGNIVHDILESHKVPNVNLTKIFRYNSSGLIAVATDTRMGNPCSFTNQYSDYNFIEESSEPVKQVVKEYERLLYQGYSKNDILILSPYNKGTAGTYAINQAIQSKFNPNPLLDVSYKRDSTTIQFAIGDKVINKKNNYNVPMLIIDAMGYEETGKSMFVANGSIGIILAEYYEDDQACFAIQFDDGIGKFKGLEITNLLLGYAVSIHASQGNQARAIIVVISKEHKRMINRNLLYVGFTRAQEHLTVIGNKEVIEDGMKIEKTAIRETWLGDMLIGDEKK